MKKSLSVETVFTEVPFYERFRKAREAGFDYVEFGNWTDLDITRVKTELEANQLRLASLGGVHNHSLLNPSDSEDFLEFLSQTIAIAKNFACPNIILESEADYQILPLDKAKTSDFTMIAAATKVLMSASIKAVRAGMNLYLKPPRIELAGQGCVRSIPDAGDIIRVVDSPVVQLCLDFSCIELGDAFTATLTNYGDLVGYIHIGTETPERLEAIRKLLVEKLRFGGIVGFRDQGCCLADSLK